LFEITRERKPSIIFFDELDTLCSSPNDPDNDREAYQCIKKELFVQMLDTEGLVIVAATNRPWMLEGNVRRRFEKRIFIGLPDASSRGRLLQIHLGNAPHNITSQQMKELEERTDGYSRCDLIGVVKEARMQPVRAVQSATHFKRVSGPSRDNPAVVVNDLLTPCSPGDPQAIETNWTEVGGAKLKEPVITLNDFLIALQSIRATVTSSELDKFNKWREDFG